MTKINSKEQFIEILQIQLLHLPEEQRIDILYDYEEHFQIGSERGEAEEEIIKKLGDPAAIAAQYRFEIADETEIGDLLVTSRLCRPHATYRTPTASLASYGVPTAIVYRQTHPLAPLRHERPERMSTDIE